VQSDRPEPGVELNSGPPTVPRPAATVMLLRGGDERLELLLVQRNPQARFMGGAWVFPGGAVDRSEGDGQQALRAAAIRELREETGITISGGDQLVPFARWITPVEVKTRFDAWFYLAGAPVGAQPVVDGAEIVDARWYVPDEALAAGAAGELFLVFPTIRQLQQLSAFASADQLLEHARATEVVPVQPRVLLQGETARIVLPGEPGYDA
jgi:8-oxo-dGTP pyrophosphatase MutT (NUDIX family)